MYDLSQVAIVVVDNQSREQERWNIWNVVRASKVSVAAIRSRSISLHQQFWCARGRDFYILFFLNNDTEVRDPDWLSKPAWYAAQPDVGVVGALSTRTEQSSTGGCLAGGNKGAVDHLLRLADQAAVGARDHTRELTLVTGACSGGEKECL